MMDLIHQANMGSVRNMDQYKRDRDRGLDDAINNFRRTDAHHSEDYQPRSCRRDGSSRKTLMRIAVLGGGA